MEVKVISRETIKPSIPTPPHLRTFKLSLLDQISVLSYTPIIFFYPKSKIPSENGNVDINNIMSRLKISLSETLSRFYPLAGRIKDEVHVNCNDEGALFTQAQVSCDLSHFLKQSNIELLHKFLDPSLNLWNLVPTNLGSTVQVAVQVNVFICGGISLAVCFLHRIADAITMKAFLKCWASIAAGIGSCSSDFLTSSIDFTIGSDLFPSKDSLPNDLKPLIQHIWKFKFGKGVQKRFVFNSKAVSDLKAKLVGPNEGKKPPSDVLVVSSFIWKHAMAASKKCNASILAFPVNIRPRMLPPLSEKATGNLIWLGVARHESKEITMDNLVALQRDSILNINGEYIRSFQGEGGVQELNRLKERVIDVYKDVDCADAYAYSSWCKLGFGELDFFGWGKPIWLSTVFGPENSPVHLNFFYLMDSVLGDEIEAILVLGEYEMSVLECDQEFLEFASVNPAIL